MKKYRQSDHRIRVGRLAMGTLLVLVLLLSGCNSKPPKVYRVGILSGMSFAAEVTTGFKDAMAELGYIEGDNIVYDLQETEFDMAVYQTILNKFIADKVDLILAFPTEATLEAKIAAQDSGIPVLFSYVTIEGMDVVDSVREPGGNITGVRYPAPDIALKRFEIMRAIAPGAKRFWIPYQRGYPNVADQVDALRAVIANEDITLIEFPADTPAEIETELRAREQQEDIGIDAMLFLSEPLAVTPEFFTVFAKFAYEHQIPIGGPPLQVGDYATLFGVVSSPYESGRLAAPIADKIFNGIAAGTIPVVSPEHFIQINYKAVLSMGLTVPESLLAQADEIIR